MLNLTSENIYIKISLRSINLTRKNFIGQSDIYRAEIVADKK